MRQTMHFVQTQTQCVVCNYKW